MQLAPRRARERVLAALAALQRSAAGEGRVRCVGDRGRPVKHKGTTKIAAAKIWPSAGGGACTHQRSSSPSPRRMTSRLRYLGHPK